MKTFFLSSTAYKICFLLTSVTNPKNGEALRLKNYVAYRLFTSYSLLSHSCSPLAAFRFHCRISWCSHAPQWFGILSQGTLTSRSRSRTLCITLSSASGVGKACCCPADGHPRVSH